MKEEAMIEPMPDPYGDSIESIQYRHHREVQGHARDEVCGHCGTMWPCDTARVLTAWDRDSERQIAATRAVFRDVAIRHVRELTPDDRLKRKGEHPDSSYDPLVRESAVIAILRLVGSQP